MSWRNLDYLLALIAAGLGLALLLRAWTSRLGEESHGRKRLLAALTGFALFTGGPAYILLDRTGWLDPVDSFRSPQTDWLQRRPTDWVMAAARASDPQIAANGYQELTRRFKAGAMSDSEVHELAELVLAECMASPNRLPRMTFPLLDLVFALHEGGCLTSDQISRFYESRFDITMRIRPRSILEVGIPMELSVHQQYVSQALFVDRPWIRLSEPPDPQLIPEGYEQPPFLDMGTAFGEQLTISPGSEPFRLRTPSSSWLLAVDSPGRRHFGVAVDIPIWRRVDSAGTPPLYRVKRFFELESEVLVSAPPDFIGLVADPDKEADVRAAIRIVKQPTMPQARRPRPPGVALSISGSPVPISCDAVLEINGVHVDLRTLCVDARQSGRTGFGLSAEPELQDKLIIRLIPNPKPAWRTVGIQVIWGQPIVFDIPSWHDLPDDR